MINKLKSSLEHEFRISDLSKLHFFLGAHFERDRRTRIISMHQQSYIKTILEQFGTGDCKPIATLLNTKTSLSKLSEDEYKEHSHQMKDIPYQKEVGPLMYAMVATRLDLRFTISVVSRLMLKPCPIHWMAVKQIMRYSKGTLDMRLCIGSQQIGIKDYFDVD